MIQTNPPHPGALIKRVYLDALSIQSTDIASHLKVSPSTVSRLINEKSSVTPIMALKLSKVLGRSPESWLALQRNYDLWKVRAKFKSQNCESIEIRSS